MGMYTQAKGMLNVDSIRGGQNFYDIQQKLDDLKEKFEEEKLVDRTWVCDGTIAMLSSNGGVFIFFGAELKNYSNEIDTWIDYLLKGFPTAEGKFDIQYEEYEFPTTYYVYQGKIVDKKECTVRQNGYGNMLR